MRQPHFDKKIRRVNAKIKKSKTLFLKYLFGTI